MKYWNKGKEKRENWTCIEVHTHFATGKKWCQDHSSKSRFYCGPYSDWWYFENPEDALAFKLIWNRRYT